MVSALDDNAYHDMLCFLDNQHCIERTAEHENMMFLKNDWWLADTAVIETIKYKKSDLLRIELLLHEMNDIIIIFVL